VLTGLSLIGLAYMLIWFGAKGYNAPLEDRKLGSHGISSWRHSGRFYVRNPIKLLSAFLGAFSGVAGLDMLF